jgi:hypothetical protein
MSEEAEERSPGGSPILRHAPRDRDWTPAESTPDVEAIEHHFDRHFGPTESVFHEIVSDLVHIDVNLIEPADDRAYWTLYTTGMSALPMTLPDGADVPRRAELLMKLPAWWQMSAVKAFPPLPEEIELNWYWPIRELKFLARLPHEYKTWLGFGHSIPNGDPPQPFAPNTKLCAWILLPPTQVPAEAQSVRLDSGEEIALYVAHALHREELDLKLTEGTDALLQRFDAARVSEVLDPARPSAVPRRGFGLFRR